MDKSRLEILPGVWLDCRRAVFLEREKILAVADLHLGYAWAHRYNGQMLPLHGHDDPLTRLSDLHSCYQPKQLALLGDIVHEAVPVTEITADLSALFTTLGSKCELKFILGNHDKQLSRLARQIGEMKLTTALEAGDFLMIHGNNAVENDSGKFVLMGHEHPAISLGDGILSAKFPCFMVGKKVLLLPAFSLWSSGSDVRSYPFMSPIARNSRFQKAIAICGAKLLPVKLS